MFSHGVSYYDVGKARGCELGCSPVSLGGLIGPTGFGPPDVLNLTARQSAGNDWNCHNDECESYVQHVWRHSSPCFQGSEYEAQYCVFIDVNFAGGRGLSIITTRQRADYLATLPAFTVPDTTTGFNLDFTRLGSIKFEVRDIPGKGKGIIATDYIRRGERILANTASLMIDYAVFSDLDYNIYTELQAYAVDHLPLAHRDAILNLSSHNATNLTYTQLLDRIIATNMFDIEPDEDDPFEEPFAVVFPDIARLNHDCRPNADYRFSHASLAQTVVASRDIMPGEEITISYIDPLQPHKERMAKLVRSWGFQCTCPLCAMEEQARIAESDARIKQILRLREELRNWNVTSRVLPQMAEVLVTLYELERLWGEIYQAYSLAALAYNAVGDEWMAVKYAHLAREWGLPMVREDDADMEEMAKLAGNPSEHWSWMKRVRRDESHGKIETEDSKDSGCLSKRVKN